MSTICLRTLTNGQICGPGIPQNMNGIECKKRIMLVSEMALSATSVSLTSQLEVARVKHFTTA